MVKLATSIIAASALIISATATANDVVSEAAVWDEAEVSLAASSDLFVSEEASGLWEEEGMMEDAEEEGSGVGLLAQLSNYIQNLIHPNAANEEEEKLTVAVAEAVEDAPQKVAKRMVGSARQRRQLNKRQNGGKGPDGLWHYSISKPKKTPLPAHPAEVSGVAMEEEEEEINMNVAASAQDMMNAPGMDAFPEQEMMNSPEMEAFPPFFHPHFDPILIGALLPEDIKKKIASKVKEKVEAAAETNTKLKEGLAKASGLFDQATKAIEEFKEKHKHSSSASATPTAESSDD